MIYEKLHAWKLQPRGEEKRDALSVFQKFHGLQEENMASTYPLSSQHWLLFIGPNEKTPEITEAVIMPEYDTPE